MKVLLFSLIVLLNFVYLQTTSAAELPCHSETSTLCELRNGTRACCPVKDAKCCVSGDYCCPKGFACDIERRRCVKDELYIPFYLKLEKIQDKKEAPSVNGGDILCPDNVTSCNDKYTCCLFQGNQYGCCVLKQAVCCNDLIHCCPHDYICNPEKGKCDHFVSHNQTISIDWVLKQPGQRVVKDNQCPDGTSSCPTGATCCQLASGQYGCCPLPNATCCDDHEHCCPNGYKCDVKDGRCLRGDTSIPFFKKTPANIIAINTVVCPGGDSSCPDQTTCCQLESGQYGCCPLPNATCCDDHEHCCPNGYKCDVKDGRCLKGAQSTPLYHKFKATPIAQKDNLCPGGTSECPDQTTCCQLESGEWGCCPLPNAVCCEDHEHCCPTGYKCDVKDGRCLKGESSVALYHKFKATPVAQKDNLCPGGTSECPDQTTCCQLESGEWGCCPLPNAVCCEDHEHCCPSGYKCDVKDGRCLKGNLAIPFYLKIQSKSVKNNELCPDKSSSCPTGATCCQLLDGQWGCCPLPNATCCADHEHCCPNGYTCDVKDSRCIQGEISVPFLRKTTATPVARNTSKGVVCPDQSQCPDGSTCCDLGSGQYGCCPLASAVCCSDHMHCCPSGYKCDVKDGRCLKGELSVPFMKKVLAVAVSNKQNTQNVLCPDGSSFCPTGTTCCKLSSGQYGCCPLPNAVCCEDHLHCCPESTVCNLQQSTCDPQNSYESVSWFNKLSAQRVFDETESKKLKSSVKCDDNLSCPPMSTCCQFGSNGYGCCKYDDAVCCDSYCCPKNTKCGEKVGECLPKHKLHSFNWHTIEIKSIRLDSQVGFSDEKEPVCPGGEIKCSNGTCCQQANSTYACCPYESGTCCGNHGYCCPKDYDCDSKLEACIYRDDLKNNKKELVTQESNKCKPGVYTSCSNGCCPLPDGNCCEGMTHCCPKDFKCQSIAYSKYQMCVRDDIIVSAVEKFPN